MLLIIHVENNTETYQLEVPDDENVECLMQLIAIETGIPLSEQRINWKGSILKNFSESLASLGISEGATIEGEALTYTVTCDT